MAIQAHAQAGPRQGPTTAPTLIQACVRSFGLEIAAARELAQARRLAAALIGPNILPTVTLRAIQTKTQSAVLTFREGGSLTGMLAVAQMSPQGRRALESGSFDAFAGRLEDYAAPGDWPSAVYALGIAAATRDAARATVLGVAALRETLLADVPFFAKAATPDGRRVLIERLSCRRLETGFFWAAPVYCAGAAA